MKKHVAMLMAAVLGAAAVLSACGGGQPAAQNGGAAAAAETSGNSDGAETPDAGNTAAPASGERVLQLWDVVVRDPHPAARDLVISMYEEQHPGVKVEVTTITGDQNEKIQAAFVGGTLPDLIFTWNPGDVTTWGQMGITTTVDDIVEEYGEDWWLSSRQLELYQLNGHTWGVPLVTFPTTFWYNKDLFDQEGLSVPTNWDEWYETAKAITKDLDGDGSNDQYGLVLGIAEGWPFDDIRGSNADYWWDEEGNLTMGDRTIETLDFLRKMFNDTCYPGSVSFQNEGQRLGFLSGQGATMVTSISFINTIIEEKGLGYFQEGHIGVAPTPMNASAEEGAGSGAATHAIGVVDGEDVDLAKDFLRFWLSEEGLTAYFSHNIPGHLPPYSVVWDKQEFQDAHADYWDIYLTGKEIIETTQWFHPTTTWQALFETDGGAGKDVMADVAVEQLDSETIVENLRRIAEAAKAEVE